MNDQQAWQRAQVAAWECYEKLSADKRQQFDLLIEQIMDLKKILLDLAMDQGSSLICGECGGICCLYGKYHVTMIDLIINRKHSPEPLVPDFNVFPHCPYGSSKGCSFAPPFRPLTCVIFNCDVLEERFDKSAFHDVVRCERELRELYVRAEVLAECRLARAALLSNVA